MTFIHQHRPLARRLYLHSYAWILLSYYVLVARTARVSWQATSVNERRLWVCWHEHLVLALIAFAAIRPPAGLCLVGWDNRRGHAMRLALARLGITVIQVSDRHDQRYGTQIGAYLVNSGSCLLTPDGPVGPARVAKPGALRISRATGVAIAPITCTTSWCWRLRRWDRIAFPLPYCRIIVSDDREALSLAMDTVADIE